MKRIVILAVAVAMMVPGIAFGASPTCNAYNPQLCGVVNTGTGGVVNAGTGSTGNAGNGTTSGQASSDALPFTGLDVGLLVAAGAMLVGSGFVIRKLSRRVN